MRITLACLWGKEGASISRAFQSSEYAKLTQDYISRIAHEHPCEIRFGSDLLTKRPKSCLLWICIPNGEGKSLATSEDISLKLKEAQNSGVKDLWIVVGGANGLNFEELSIHHPNFKWSFGPLTLPHELAAVVASEQIYRGFTILKGHPYHLGH